MIGDEGVTVVAQTPTFYIALAAHEASDGPVGQRPRCITYGGPISPHAIEAWRGGARRPWGTYWGQSELSQLGTVGWFRSLDDIPGGDPTGSASRCPSSRSASSTTTATTPSSAS